MRKKIIRSTAALLLTAFLFIGTSCDNDSNMPQWTTIELTIAGKHWLSTKSWNYAYHFYVREIPQLTEEIFRRGGARVFFMYNRNRKTPLPYLKTFPTGTGYYTEYLKYSLRLGTGGQPSTIKFRLVASDLGLYSMYPPCTCIKIILESW